MSRAPLAICLTPDAAYFKQAVATALSILDQDDADRLDVMILCEDRDLDPEFEKLDPVFRKRIAIQIVDWSKYTDGLPTRAPLSSAVHRRLALHRVLPERYSHFVSMDADMVVMRPGLGCLATLDLGDAPLAAAVDMIFWKDCDGGPLADEFRAYRARLGLARETPYFNNGLTFVDRHRWESADLRGEAIRYMQAHPGACRYLEQSALNAIVQGRFAPLSPRYNFMGDFLQLDLEDEIAPVILHFVNHPKPFHAQWGGPERFRQLYRALFARTPWPDAANSTAQAAVRPPQPFDASGFGTRLRGALRNCHFADGWTMPLETA